MRVRSSARLFLPTLLVGVLVFPPSLFLPRASAATANWQWAKRLGGTDNDYGYGVTTDSSGNVIVTGYATGNADLNGDGEVTDGGAEEGGGSQDIILSVFNASGTWQWAKRLGGVAGDVASAVTTDSSDSIILVGTIQVDADVNGDGDSTDGGAEDGTGYAEADVLLSVFNTSGTFQWAKRLGGTGSDYGYGVTTDSSGNVIVSGSVFGNADLNGDGDSTDGGAEDGTGYAEADVLLSVFNTSGTFQWAKRLGLTDNDYGYSVATDSSGNVIVAGYVTGNADLNGDGDSTDGGAEDATGYGNTDIVISVFNSSGTWQWAKRMGGIYEDQGFDVAVWGSTIAVTGLVSSGDGERFPVVNIDVNGDGDTTDGGVEDTTTYDGRNLLSVFNSAGTFQWAKRLSGNGNSNGITFDPSGNIVLSNTMFGNADVNGDGDSTDGGAEDGTGYAEADVLLSVFNTSGTFQWAKRLGGTDNDYGFSVATDTSGNVIVTGGLTGDADMNGDGDATDGGAEDATGYGSIDAFLSVFVQDYDPPVPSSFTPASSSTITSATPTVTLSLDEAGDCRASTSDESYADMSNDTDCTGDGTQNISCSIPLGSPGAKTVYIACQDSSGNTDSAGTNVSLSFTLDGGGGAAATRSLQQFWEAYDLEHGGKGTSIPSPTPSVPGPVSSPAAPSPPPVYVPPPRPPRLTPLDRRALRLQRLLQQQRSPPSTLAPAAQGGIPSSLLPRMLSTARIQLMLDRAEQRRFKRLRSH